MPLIRGSLALLAGLSLTILTQLGRGQENVLPAERLPPGALARFGTLRLRQPYRNSAAVFVAFSPDGKILATRSDDLAVRLWDAATGRLLHPLKDANPPTAFAFSPDSRTLAISLGDRIRRWDTTTGKPLNGWNASASSLAFLPDGGTLISGGPDRSVRSWDVAAGKEVRVFGEKLEPIVAVAVSRDGKVVAAGGQRGTVYLWDDGGKELRRLPRDGSRLFDIAFSPNSKFLAVGTRKTIHLWDTANGKELHQCGSPLSDDVTSYNNDAALAFAPDGRSLAAVGKQIRIHDLDAKEFQIPGRPWAVQLPQRASSVAFAPDGKRLAVAGCDQEIRLFAADGKWQPGVGHQHRLTCVAVSLDGRTVATGARDHSLYLWDIQTGKSRQRLVGHSSTIRAVAFSADGKQLVSGDAGGTVRAWEVASGKELHAIQAHREAVAALALSPDGKQLASGGEDGGLRIYDLAREKVLHDFPRQRNGATALAFSAEGRLLASSDGEGGIAVWQAATGEPEGKPKPSEDDNADDMVQPIQGPPAPLGRVQLLAFVPGNKRLIFWSRDGAFGLWDIVAARAIRRHDGPAGSECTAAISADGRTLVLCDRDNRLSLRETATGQERALLPGHDQQSIGAAAFAPDGRKLVSAGSDTTALVWDITGRLREDRLPTVRLTQQQLDGIWSDLAGDDARKAFQGIWSLIAGAADAVPFLQERLKPVTVKAKHIEKLIADLDSNQFPVRNRARAELEELAELAESALKNAVGRKPPLEVRKRLEMLLEKIQRERNALNPHRLRVVRAIEALEQIGNPQARRLLKILADAPPELRLTEEVKQEARASLERFGADASEKRR